MNAALASGVAKKPSAEMLALLSVSRPAAKMTTLTREQDREDQQDTRNRQAQPVSGHARPCRPGARVLLSSMAMCLCRFVWSADRSGGQVRYIARSRTIAGDGLLPGAEISDEDQREIVHDGLRHDLLCVRIGSLACRVRGRELALVDVLVVLLLLRAVGPVEAGPVRAVVEDAVDDVRVGSEGILDAVREIRVVFLRGDDPVSCLGLRQVDLGAQAGLGPLLLQELPDRRDVGDGGEQKLEVDPIGVARLRQQCLAFSGSGR